MGAKIERCKICYRKFGKKDVRYTVTLASVESCGYSTKFVGKEKVTRLFGKARYVKRRTDVCERCVVAASIEEILGFGKVLPTKNYIPEFEGKGESCETYKVGKKFKFYDDKDLYEDDL